MPFIQTTAQMDRPAMTQQAMIGFLLAFLAGIFIAWYGGLAVAALIGLVFAILLFPRPLVAINLIVCLVAFDSIFPAITSEVYSLTGTKVVGYILAASLGVKILTGSTKVRIDGTFIAISLFLIGIAISFFAAKDLTLAIKESLRFIQLIILFFAVREFITEEKHLLLLGKVAVISLTLSAIVGIYQYSFLGTERIQGTSQNAAILASDLMVGVAFGYILFRLGKTRRIRLFYAILTLIIIISILSTMTRAAFLAVFPALFFVGLASGRVVKMFSLFVIICILSVITAPTMINRLISTYEAQDNSTRQHVYTLYAGMAMTWDYPITGVGVGNYPVHYLRYTNDSRRFERTAHNSYLSISSEMGLGTLTAFLMLHLIAITSLYRATYMSRKYKLKGLLLICYGVLFILISFYTISLFHTLRVSKLFWIFLAISCELPSIVWKRGQAQKATKDNPKKTQTVPSGEY